MTTPYPQDLTAMLNRMLRGDQESGNEAMDLLYTSLRRIAASRMHRERRNHILDTGALVNEAIVRLFGSRAVSVQNRQHFFALVCLLMKRILIDSGRRKEPEFACLEESMRRLDPPDIENILTIDGMLERLRRLDPQAYRAFQLKVGAGMTAEEIAHELSCSAPTVHRCLKRARTWMYKEMRVLV